MLNVLKNRGESTVKFEDREVKLKASFEALDAIEEKLDLSLVKLAYRMSKGDVRLKDIARILYESAIAAGEKISYAEVGDYLIKLGFYNFVAPATEIVNSALLAGSKEIPADPNAQKPEG